MPFEVLVRLADAESGEIRTTGLAGALHTAKSGLTYQITQLEKTGLVRRRTRPSDTRGAYAALIDVLSPQQLAGSAWPARCGPARASATGQGLMTP
ncbi:MULTISPECIES: MarR family transcriptional regulator [unclassified Streptomyces]|uniref:MarR family transcriptional regulator n=1 Tax=unclassified Streptomyces TaxID=2593676 RepID=UPI001EF9B122|nr:MULTISPECIES: MarR family transcriptional regulator [unclassified Streptomyces]